MVKYMFVSLLVFFYPTHPYCVLAQGMQVGSGAHLILKGPVHMEVTGGSDLTLAEGSAYSSDEQSVLRVDGSLINENETPVSIGEVIFEGDQQHATLQGNFILKSLTLNTSQQVNMTGNTDIQTQLNLIRGKLMVAAGKQLMIDEKTIITNSSKDSYIVGLLGIKVSEAGEKNLIFPLGTDKVYAPVTFIFDKSDSDTAIFSLEATENDEPDYPLPSTIMELYGNVYWKLNVNDTKSKFSNGTVLLPLTGMAIDTANVLIANSEEHSWSDLGGKVLQDSNAVRSVSAVEKTGILTIGIPNKNLAFRVEPATEFITIAESQEAKLIFSNATDLDPNSVMLKYRSLRGEAFDSVDLTTKNDTVVAILSKELFKGDFGIEYYFVFEDKKNGKHQSQDIYYAYFQYDDNAFAISDLKSGDKVNDYQLISVPLNLVDKAVSSVMGDDFGGYDSTAWRLFHYVDVTRKNIEYNQGFTTIERGKGYWLILKDPKTLTFGNGNMVLPNDQPYEIPLSEGWNQIGNPYNFSVKWSDIFKYNKLTADGLRIVGYRDGTTLDLKSDSLKKYEGVFVENKKGLNKILIPYKKDIISNGRVNDFSKENDQESWVLSFALRGGDMGYNIGGLGMRAGASIGKDLFDSEVFPRFINFLDINFGDEITKDMVPIQEEYRWHFKVESNLDVHYFLLVWAVVDRFPWDKQLILFDTEKNLVIDMLEEKSYAFEMPKGENEFEVYYGDKNTIFEKIASDIVRVGDPFPVPVNDHVSFSVLLPKNKQGANAKVEIFNSLGEKVSSTERKGFEMGYSELVIPRYIMGGNDSKGLCFYRVYVDDQLVKIGKLLLAF